MTEEVKVPAVDEKTAAAAGQQPGRQSDMDAVIKAQQAAAAAEAKDQAVIDAENKAAEEAAAKAKAEADAKEKEDKKDEDRNDDGTWKTQWVTTGNPHADAAIDLMKSAGMSPVEGNELFKEAVAAQDLSKINWELLEARIGKPQTLLVKAGVEQYWNTEGKAQQEVVDYAYKQVGGEDGWKAIQAWAKKQEANDPAFRGQLAEYREALKVGGFAARAAVDAIKQAYEGAPGNGTTGNAPLARGSSLPNASADVVPLTRLQYYNELQKAGGDRAPAGVIDALNKRRQAGIKAGI